MNIDGVRNGIVLDHIQAGKGMQIYSLLGLEKLDCTVAIIQNAVSTKYGRKDIIKVDGKLDLNLDMLGYIDQNITVDFIEDCKLIKKVHVDLPETLKNVISCHNPRCITSIEQGVEQEFYLADREKKIYRCRYCDTEYREID
ncbi:MAG: aspartate carbamoyltransferase regulatory subunit [Eubacteriales bacterium]|nr:aspartate carbamoyltransferase regulatory subunit [Eubacteriales bacterium]